MSKFLSSKHILHVLRRQECRSFKSSWPFMRTDSKRTPPPEINVELTDSERNLRQQLLTRATLTESVLGKNGALDATKALIMKKRQEIAEKAAEKQKDAEKQKAETEKIEEVAGPPVEKSSETALHEVLRERLKLGPMPVSEYMSLAMSHDKHGYYMTHEIFGSKGDFITAPEISQTIGCPSKLQLVELGPGRGTMMMDILRSVGRFRPMVSAVSVHLVETSAALREVQRKRLSTASEPKAPVARHDGTGILIKWHDSLLNVPLDPKVPSIILAQEFLDCLPVRQFQHTEKGWCERMVDVDTSPQGPHHLRYVLSPGPTPAAKVCLQPDLVPKMPKEEIGRRVSLTGGGALIIDYGNDGPMADSVQAIKAHKFVHPLSEPGECDITAHVDFSAIKKAALDGFTPTDASAAADARAAIDARAAAAGAAANPPQAAAKQEGDEGAGDNAADPPAAKEMSVMPRAGLKPLAAHGPTTQGEFLHGMGIVDRAKALIAAAPSHEEKIMSEYHRLTGPDQMGSLFKVLAITRVE